MAGAGADAQREPCRRRLGVPDRGVGRPLCGRGGRRRAATACSSGSSRAIWSLRLGTYLLVNRVLGKPEDGRYEELRTRWRARDSSVNGRFFVFFEAQALLVVIFAVPSCSRRSTRTTRSSRSQWAGAALWAVGIARRGDGRPAARSLRAPTRPTKGRRAAPASGATPAIRTTSSSGSIWVAYALIAYAAPWGWIGWIAPALMLTCSSA